MNSLNNFIPLLSSFLPGFFEMFLIIMIPLAFIATVPYIIRCIFKVR